MKDGFTKRLDRPAKSSGATGQLLREFEVRLVAIAGPASGTSYAVNRERTVLGRGPGVDHAFDDRAMSRQHAVLEAPGATLTVRDLGSTNGISVNGTTVKSAELHHGDRLQLGTWAFQVLVEARSDAPDAYELSVDA
jgi:pSer/pThr/pTyr-binding forkhead associated (FHA) protein